MVTPVKVRARVVVDNTGTECEMPIIVTEQGVLSSLLDYLLSHRHVRSPSWMDKVVHATYLLMLYMEATVVFNPVVQKSVSKPLLDCAPFPGFSQG
jgi:ribulose 1,5-bisphosphate synthetase/thiazole synthase